MRLSVLFRAAKPRLALPGAAVAGSMCGLLAATGDWRVFGTALLIAGGVVLHRLYRYDLSALLFDGLIVLLPVMAIVGGGGFSLNIALSDALLPFAILVCLAGKCGRRRGLAGDFGLPAVYGFCLFLAVTASLFKNLILSGTYAPAGVVNLVKLLVNIVYLLLFQTYFRQEKYRERLPAVWGGTAMVFSGLGIAGVVLYFLGRQTGLTLAYRLTGTVTDPNLAASYLLVSLGFALAANRQAGRPLLRPNTILPGVALLLTASRGGNAGLAAGCLLLLGIDAVRRENSRLLRVTIGLTAILIIFALAGEKFDPGRVFLDRLAGTFNPADNGSRGRLLLWKAALRLGMREPLLGVGPMRFAPAASDLLAREITNIPHNTYLGAFAETGLCGLAALIWFPVLLAARLGRRALGGDAPAALLLFALGGTAVQAFTINVENMRFLWLLLAFIYVRTEQPGPEGAVVGFGYGAAGRERSGSAPGEMRR